MKKLLKKLFFPVLGSLSLAWFLIRVINKPSRINYPCMKATMPIATSFLVYLAGMLSSVLAFKKARKYLVESKYWLFTAALLAGIVLITATHIKTDKRAYALTQTTLDPPNSPMGVGQGIFPGRVVWIHNPDATNENCTNSRNDYWYQDDNTNQAVVDQMVSDAVQKLTETQTNAAAWDALFHHFNQKQGKGNVGYTAGEKFVIKINFNGVSQGKDKINTSPQICYSILDQLINDVGVAQKDIGIGDPNFNFDTPHWNKCHTAFPNVVYWGPSSTRTPVTRSAAKAIYTSDGTLSDYLPKEYADAAYMINIPVFKKHHRGGISLTSKLHFGSVTPFNGSAFHWHFSLPASEGGGDVNNPDYGTYRCFVDIMGHKDLGGKTILNLVDGLWSSINWGHPPIKWRMAPFNNDYPNSVFASQDPVAIESVGFDFLYHEFDQNHPTEGAYDRQDNHGPFPRYAGSDDFLRQAADKANWPKGIIYDPENDGTPLPESMGVFEHWNNADDKQYSKNLGTGNGIELVTGGTTAVKQPSGQVNSFVLHANYPNPFNPDTEISYELPVTSQVTLRIYNAMGQTIRNLTEATQHAGLHTQKWDGYTNQGLQAASGVYFCHIQIHNQNGVSQKSQKMILSR